MIKHNKEDFLQLNLQVKLWDSLIFKALILIILLIYLLNTLIYGKMLSALLLMMRILNKLNKILSMLKSRLDVSTYILN
jgi:hypothetical protein